MITTNPFDALMGDVNVSQNRRVPETCPDCKPLPQNDFSRFGTHGHVAEKNSFFVCVRMCACVRARTYIHTYLVSLVSMCPNPLWENGLRSGHVRDTSNQVSLPGKEVALP